MFFNFEAAKKLTELYCSGRIPGECLGTALVIIKHMNKRGECFPSVKLISSLTKENERTVRRHIQKLVAGGFIIKKRRARNSNLYTLADRTWVSGQRVYDRTPVSALSGHGCPPNYNKNHRAGASASGVRAARKGGDNGRGDDSCLPYDYGER